MFLFFGTADYWCQFAISECLTFTVRHWREGVHMAMKLLAEVMSCVRRLIEEPSLAEVAVPASRHSLLKSP